MSSTLRFKIAYSLAHLGKIGLWEPGELFFAVFMTEVCGFAPLSMALCLGVSMAANLLADLAVGFRFHRLLSTPLRAARLQVAGAVLCAIGLLLFALTPWISKSLQFAYAMSTLVLFRASYSALDQPQNLMLALNTGSDRDRSQLVALRNISGGSARLIMAAAFAPLFIGPPGSLLADRFFALALGIGVASILGAITLFLSFPRLKADRAVAEVAAETRTDLRVWQLLLLELVASSLASVWTKLLPYLLKFELSPATSASLVLTCLMLGMIASQTLWQRLQKRFSLTTLLSIGLGSEMAAALIFKMLASEGETGAVIASLLMGTAQGGTGMAIWALMASIAKQRQAEMKPSFVASLFSASSKSGFVIAYGLTGLVLSSINYQVDTPIAGTLSTAMLVIVLAARALMLGFIALALKQTKTV